MSTTLQNSIWPNPEGPLGVITTEIPDGTNVQWPEGDALVENFVYKNGKLNGVVDTKALILNQTAATIIPYEYINVELESILETTLNVNLGEQNKYFNIKYGKLPNGKLPVGYTKLAYLENASSSYIKLPLQVDKDTGCYAILERKDPADKIPLGARQGYGGKRWYPPRGNGGWGNSYGWGEYYYLPDHGKVGSGIIHSYLNWKNDGLVTCRNVNGESSENLSKHNWSDFPTDNVQLFNCGNAYVCKCCIYSVIFSHGSNIIMNFVPALDETGAPCMYDSISETPYYNSGTSDFLYPGAESSITTSSLDDIFYAKLTSTGIRRLYHVPANYKGSKDEYAVENGYKELVEPPMPEESYWIPQWNETDTQLICEWVEIEPPAEELV